MEAPGIKVFRYYPRAYQPAFVLFAATLLLSATFVFIYLTSDRVQAAGGAGRLTACFVASLLAFGLLPLLLRALAFPTICLSSDALCGVYFGRLGRNILWNEITEAQKSKYYDRLFNRYRVYYRVRSSHGSISFDQYVEGLTELLMEINRQAGQHGFPLFETDPAGRNRTAVQALDVEVR